MSVPVVNLELVKGEDNFFDLDLSTDIDAGDQVWFTAKYRRSDVTPALAYTRASGIVDVAVGSGQCQVQVPAADCDDLEGRALIYDVKVKKADVDQVSTAVTGVIRMIDPVNTTAT